MTDEEVERAAPLRPGHEDCHWKVHADQWQHELVVSAGRCANPGVEGYLEKLRSDSYTSLSCNIQYSST